MILGFIHKSDLTRTRITSCNNQNVFLHHYLKGAKQSFKISNCVKNTYKTRASSTLSVDEHSPEEVRSANNRIPHQGAGRSYSKEERDGSAIKSTTYSLEKTLMLKLRYKVLCGLMLRCVCLID